MAVVGDLFKGIGSGNASIKFLAFTADGKSVAAASWDNTLVLWDVDSGEVKRQFGGLKQPLYCFALSSDDKTLAAACTGDNTVRGYDLANGKEVFKISPGLLRVEALAFAPGNKSLAIGGMVEEGNRLLEGDGIWDIATGKQLVHLNSISFSMIFTPDGSTLLAAGTYAIRLFDPTTGKELQARAGHTYPVPILVFAPDDKTLVSGGGDRTVRWWDLQTGKQTRLDGRYSPLAFSPDGRQFACLVDGKVISIRDANTGKELHALKEHARADLARFSADGKTLVSVGDGHTIVWNVAEAKEVSRITPKGTGIAFSLSADGTLLGIGEIMVGPTSGGAGLPGYASFSRQSGSIPQPISIYDIATGKTVGQFQIVDGARCLAFSPDNKLLFAGTGNGGVCVLDAKTGKETLRFTADDSRIQYLAVSPDGKLLATSSDKQSNNVIRVWQSKTGKKLDEFPANGCQINSLAFSPDGRLLASGGADSTIMLWDVAEKGKK